MDEFFKVAKDGCEFTFCNEEGKPHREGDKPAVIRFKDKPEVYKNGELITDYDELTKFVSCDLEYWINGKRHMVIEYDADNVSRTIRFYDGSQLHREGDKPAVIYPDGTEEYYKNGLLHRDGDKPAVIKSDGTEEYYENGQLYRVGDETILWARRRW